jgi:hypothetical protein
VQEGGYAVGIPEGREFAVGNRQQAARAGDLRFRTRNSRRKDGKAVKG